MYGSVLSLGETAGETLRRIRIMLSTNRPLLEFWIEFYHFRTPKPLHFVIMNKAPLHELMSRVQDNFLNGQPKTTLSVEPYSVQTGTQFNLDLFRFTHIAFCVWNFNFIVDF